MTDTDLEAAARRIVELANSPRLCDAGPLEAACLNHAPALAAEYLRLRELEKAARGVHGLHMSLTSMAAPREFYDALWALDAALAALDQHRKETSQGRTE